MSFLQQTATASGTNLREVCPYLQEYANAAKGDFDDVSIRAHVPVPDGGGEEVRRLRMALERVLDGADADLAAKGNLGIVSRGQQFSEPRCERPVCVYLKQELDRSDSSPTLSGREDRADQFSEEGVAILRGVLHLLDGLQHHNALDCRPPLEIKCSTQVPIDRQYDNRCGELHSEERPPSRTNLMLLHQDVLVDDRRQSFASGVLVQQLSTEPYERDAGNRLKVAKMLKAEAADAEEKEENLERLSFGWLPPLSLAKPAMIAHHQIQNPNSPALPNLKLSLQDTEGARRLFALERERDGALAALSEAMNVISEAKDRLQLSTQQVAELQQENEILQSELERTKAELNETRSSTAQRLTALKLELSSHQAACGMAREGYRIQQGEVEHLSELLAQQEKVIEQLHAELQDLMEERSFESELMLLQAEELRAALAIQNDEKQMVDEQLEKVKLELVSQTKHAQDMESSMKATRRQCNNLIAANEGDLRQLREDNVELKKRLVRLIKDKDNLWHKADSLVHRQKEKAEVKWIPDCEATQCLSCGTHFSFTLRKHHCRLCGRIFCSRCVNNWIMTVSSSRKARICNACLIERTEATLSDSLPMNADGESDHEEAVTEPVSIMRSMRRWLKTSLSASSSAIFINSRSSEDGAHVGVLARSSSHPAIQRSSASSFAHTVGGCFEDSFEVITDLDIAQLSSCETTPTTTRSTDSTEPLLVDAETDNRPAATALQHEAHSGPLQ